jgi:hypothetical protein
MKNFNYIAVSSEPFSNASILLAQGTDQYFLTLSIEAWLGHDLILEKLVIRDQSQGSGCTAGIRLIVRPVF